MSVRKRTWTTPKGDQREAWVVDYRDADGDRCMETFAKKKDADKRRSEIDMGKSAGTHVARSKSVTVRDAGEAWIAAAKASELERATLLQYRQHLDLHIAPKIGSWKLVDLTPRALSTLEQAWLAEGRSRSMVRKLRVSLGSILANAMDEGRIAHNVVRDISRRQKGKKRLAEKRQKGKLKVGVNIPTPAEISAILAHTESRWRPLLLVASFTGLRASEIRGLSWHDVDLNKSVVHVRQRADRYNEIGNPKSEDSHRAVPFGKIVSNTLKDWKLACPKGELDLVFPNGAGNVETLGNIVKRGFIPAQIAAGVITGEGKAKYTGLHALRHFYASWCINRLADGGRELPPKTVQERLGHASITLTLDRYGHLFPSADDAQLDDAELALVNAAQMQHGA